jgi:glyoxylase-like metal-dependent hydrolase (beta-lactamase superfamily II)
MAPTTELVYEVFVSDSLPQMGRGTLPNGETRIWSPLSSTLISGQENAVLVDPPMTVEQTRMVGDWVEASGKTLSHIYITHGHGDHWFGAGPLAERFPGLKVLATPGTIQEMTMHGSPEFRSSFWDSIFPDLIPPTTTVTQPIDSGSFELEGHELQIVEVGHTDTDNTTMLFVPSIGLLVAGDAVYNGVHPYLTESQEGGIESWLQALDVADSLEPQFVVAGHKNPTSLDVPRQIEDTRRYLLDASKLLSEKQTPGEFFSAMLALHPDRINPGALWGAALKLLG